MGPIKVLTYLTGFDIIAAEQRKECEINELYRGWSKVVEIISLRTRVTAHYAGTMAFRLSGLDAAHRISQHFDNLPAEEIPEEPMRKVS